MLPIDYRLLDITVVSSKSYKNTLTKYKSEPITDW